MSLPLASLALLPYPQDTDDIEHGIEPIKCEIAGMPSRDDKLPDVTVCSPADGRMFLKYVDCTADAFQRQPCDIGAGLKQELEIRSKSAKASSE